MNMLIVTFKAYLLATAKKKTIAMKDKKLVTPFCREVS